MCLKCLYEWIMGWCSLQSELQPLVLVKINPRLSLLSKTFVFIKLHKKDKEKQQLVMFGWKVGRFSVERKKKFLSIFCYIGCLMCHSSPSSMKAPFISLPLNSDPIYFWQQTTDDITVCVRVPEGITKEDVQFRLTADNISIGVQAFPPLLEGQLYASVDPEASAWVIKNDKRFGLLNVCLTPQRQRWSIIHRHYSHSDFWI